MCIQLVTKSERRIFQVTLKYSNLYISSEIYTKGEKNPTLSVYSTHTVTCVLYDKTNE